MEMQEKFLLGALLGSAIGAAAALIFTPMSGERMRQKIIDEIQGAPRQTARNNRHAHSRHNTNRRRPTTRAVANHKAAGNGEKTQAKKAESKTPRKTASVGLKVQAQKS